MKESHSIICPTCSSSSISLEKERTSLGYERYRCKECRKRFNQRTGTPFNHLEYPTDMVMLVVLWRIRYKLSLRDLAEMFIERGFFFTHEAVRSWEERFAPLIAQELRKRRQGKVGKRWFTDETYVKIEGKWRYLYRAIDEYGNLVDCRLSEKRDMEAAQAFFRSALEVAEKPPKEVITDGHISYPRAILEELGQDVRHRTGKHQNDRIEQDHRGIKQRYYPMMGFGAFDSANRFCSVFDELKNYFRYRSHYNEILSLSEKRSIYQEKFNTFMSVFSLS